ncbi:MAG: hypothetical protein PHQ19_08995 [Candidatus Krumholzibacteria bacterium]|nr:hypothetical protein [Candidatus Krumholzibacteria bacterium]
MFKGKVLLFSLVLVFATSLYAGDVDECESNAGTSCALRVSICPAGDFEYIRNGCMGDADYIWVQIEDALGAGIAGIPWTDYWMNACLPAQELCLCASPIAADSLTNELGQTTFSGRIAGGGCVLTGGLYVACQGKVLLEQPECVANICIDMVVVSPDINATCKVDLSDLSFFGESYNKNLGDPDFNPCCDYNDDSKCDLSDFSFLGEHYLHECF